VDPMTAFLLSMQAAGLVTSVFGYKSQQNTIRQGRMLEEEQFKTNMQAIKLESAESSLDEMKQVRQNIGDQIVANAAKGNRGGSSYLGIQESVSTLNSDERKRRMNLLAKESQLRANHVLAGLHTLESETALGQSLMKDVLNTLPISSGLDALFNPNKKKSSNNATSNTGGNFNWGY
jgi:hypothetical protein